jgi:hypothetical protein
MKKFTLVKKEYLFELGQFFGFHFLEFKSGKRIFEVYFFNWQYSNENQES